MAVTFSRPTTLALLALLSLATSCATAEEGGEVFDAGDKGKPTPEEPETDGDPDAAVKLDGESVPDEVGTKNDGSTNPTEDLGGGGASDAGSGTNPGSTDAPPPNPGFDAGVPLPGMDAGGAGPMVPTGPLCRRGSTNESAPMQELDAPAGGPGRLSFEVREVPADIARALLRFDSFDADRPTLEGRIYVNGMGSLDLPADRAWTNRVVIDNTVDVTPFVREGTNVVEFGPGPLDRAVYRIGRVALEVIPRGGSCSPDTVIPVPDGGTIGGDGGGPTGRPVRREIRYDQATYTLRNNYVFRCASNYAYTARGRAHLTVDCPRRYNPDGTLRATATFRFDNVIRGTYDVLVRSRHSSNRNRMRALFVVNGERRRIDQRRGSSGLTLVIDTWGRRALGGTVTVVLDSRRNQGSDSVSAVILRPVP